MWRLASRVTFASRETRFVLYCSCEVSELESFSPSCLIRVKGPIELVGKNDSGILYLSASNAARRIRLSQTPPEIEFILLSEFELCRATLQCPRCVTLLTTTCTHFTHHRMRKVEPNAMPLRLQSLLSSVHDEVTNPCRNQCFINQVEKVCPLPYCLPGT